MTRLERRWIVSPEALKPVSLEGRSGLALMGCVAAVAVLSVRH